MIDDAERRDLLALSMKRLTGSIGWWARLPRCRNLTRRRSSYTLRPPLMKDIASRAEKSPQLLGKHELRLQIPESLPKVRVDLERIEEVLIHLLENAAKYSPRERRSQ